MEATACRVARTAVLLAAVEVCVCGCVTTAAVQAAHCLLPAGRPVKRLAVTASSHFREWRFTQALRFHHP